MPAGLRLVRREPGPLPRSRTPCAACSATSTSAAPGSRRSCGSSPSPPPRSVGQIPLRPPRSQISDRTGQATTARRAPASPGLPATRTRRKGYHTRAHRGLRSQLLLAVDAAPIWNSPGFVWTQTACRSARDYRDHSFPVAQPSMNLRRRSVKRSSFARWTKWPDPGHSSIWTVGRSVVMCSRSGCSSPRPNTAR